VQGCIDLYNLSRSPSLILLFASVDAKQGRQAQVSENGSRRWGARIGREVPRRVSTQISTSSSAARLCYSDFRSQIGPSAVSTGQRIFEKVYRLQGAHYQSSEADVYFRLDLKTTLPHNHPPSRATKKFAKLHRDEKGCNQYHK
jgi:hypothetical protein